MLNNGKANIEKKFDGVSIILPSKKNWFAQIFGTVWLGGWFIGFTSASDSFFSKDINNSGIDLFLTFWLLGWTVGGISLIVLLIWGYFGKEKFIIQNNEVFFEKTVYDFGIKLNLQKSAIKNFRIELNNYDNNNNWFGNNNLGFWGIGPGKIKFDYGLKTYSFALGLDDAEANYIVKLLKEYFRED